MDILSLSKADRERMKALIKTGDKAKLLPFVNQILAPRVSKPIPISRTLNQLPSNISMEYSRGLMAPLCSDLRELPRADAVYAMLFAMESYIKSVLSNTISKRRYNRSIGFRMPQDRTGLRSAALGLDEKDNASGTLMTKQQQQQQQQQKSLNVRDLTFSFRITPYVMVENLLNAERLTALNTDSEDEEMDEDLDDSDSDSGNDFVI
ncbi:unnamed protein product [Absidia cylindrospora]